MAAAKLAWLAALVGCSWENSAEELERLREAINQKRHVKKGGMAPIDTHSTLT